MHLFTVKFDAAATDADQLLDNVDENVVMKALDGFLLILSNDGDVIYVSENIQEHIGIQQVCNRMIFRFFDFSRVKLGIYGIFYPFCRSR